MSATIAVETRCPECRGVKVMAVDAAAYTAWRRGEVLVQEAFPRMDPPERERLVTGICPECWDRIFLEAEGEEEWCEGCNEPGDGSPRPETAPLHRWACDGKRRGR